MRGVRLSSWDRRLLAALGIMTVLGLFLLPQYGESWDEHNMFYNAATSWKIFLARVPPFGEEVPKEHPVLRLYGSWPWMLSLAGF